MSEFVLSGQELFGRYARIAYGHALDGKQDYHIYKCIRSFMSNCYCDVPLTYQTENNCHTHDNIVEVVNVLHCGIDENRVIRVARNDIALLPAPDVEPVQQWIPVTERLPESGVQVLLCCEVRYGGEIAGKYVCDGYYAEANKIVAGGFPDECNCEYSEEDDEFYLREGWYEVIKNWYDYNSVAVEDFVTHWMPLPEPPKEVET